jgi:hypothetical protein
VALKHQSSCGVATRQRVAVRRGLVGRLAGTALTRHCNGAACRLNGKGGTQSDAIVRASENVFLSD